MTNISQKIFPHFFNYFFSSFFPTFFSYTLSCIFSTFLSPFLSYFVYPFFSYIIFMNFFHTFFKAFCAIFISEFFPTFFPPEFLKIIFWQKISNFRVIGWFLMKFGKQKVPIWQFLSKKRQYLGKFGDFWRKCANMAVSGGQKYTF